MRKEWLLVVGFLILTACSPQPKGLIPMEDQALITVFSEDKNFDFEGKRLTFRGDDGTSSVVCKVPVIWQWAEVDGKLMRLASVLPVTTDGIVFVDKQENDAFEGIEASGCGKVTVLSGRLERGEVVDRTDWPDLEKLR